MLTTLHIPWELDEVFEGEYMRDYQALHNELRKGELPGWTSTPLLCTQQNRM